MDDNLTERLNNIMLIADELPVALIIHRLEDHKVIYMNKTGLDPIEATLGEVQHLTTEEYHLKYFNTEDSDDYVPKILNLVKTGSNEKVCYFQQVHSPANKEWKLYASNTQVFLRNAAGEATHLITTASLLDPVHQITVKINRLMEEVGFLRQNALLFSELTKREKEVLACMATGLNSEEIADKLFIAASTVGTHRKNIRNKLGLKNNYDAVIFAQAYNLV